MKELKKTKRITIGSIALVLVLILAFISFKEPPYTYKLTPSEMAEELYMVYQVTPEEVMEYMYDTTAAILIDIRSIYDYEKAHLENAYNIPVPNLLDEAYKQQFDSWLADTTLVILYGKDEMEANSPWMLLYELGYTNVRTLMGGMSYIDKLYEDTLEEGETFNVEDPRYDFAGIIAAGSVNNQNSADQVPKRKVTVRKKEKKATEGGC